MVRAVVRCFGPSSSMAPSKRIICQTRRSFVALAQATDSNEDIEQHERRVVDKYADIGTPLRKVSPKVYQIVEEIKLLDKAEAKIFQDTLVKKLTAMPVKKEKNWEPFPVRARVPFPHPEAIFAGIFCNRMPGVGGQQMHPLAAMMMMPHMAKMASEQPQGVAAVQTEAAPAAAEGGEEAEDAGAKEEEKKVEKSIVAIKLEAFPPEKKIAVIKEVRALTGLGLKESKDLVESAPKVVKKGVARADAEAFMTKLTELGATIGLE